MKLNEIKEVTVEKKEFRVITPDDTFGDVMKCMPNYLTSLKALALENRIPGKTYSDIMKLKVKKQTLHGDYNIDDVLVTFGRDAAPIAFLWCEVIPFSGFSPVDIGKDSSLRKSRLYIKLELDGEVKYCITFSNVSDAKMELVDTTKANLIRQVFKTVQHNSPDFRKELARGKYDGDVAVFGSKIFGWVVFQ